RTISTGSGLSGGGNLTADRTLTVDSTVVRTTGNQTLGGTKTFTSTISGSITGNAGTVGGLSVHAGRNNEVNKVVRTDASGYLQAGWINTTSGNRGTTAPTRIYASNDEYIRYYTPANFATVMDSYFVRTSGNQTSIAGTKNFTGNVGVGSSSTAVDFNVDGNVFFRGGDGDYNLNGFLDVGDSGAAAFFSKGLTLITEANKHQVARLDLNADGRIDRLEATLITNAHVGNTTISAARLTARNIVNTNFNIDINGNMAIGPNEADTFSERLNVMGNAVANAYYYTSDIRLKENISNVENSLSKILKLQGISYNLIGNEDKRLGFSAQELQKIYPELVKEGSDGYLSIDGTGLIAPLVEAIKEQQREIDELKRKVEELSKN
ncbi:MAG: tail fiber domain-containing protein, partial [Candidatus Pacebacteria bacterium]|nr:tail fiber domain-containing protein [Candidatus Paceibacterota bacterium]